MTFPIPRLAATIGVVLITPAPQLAKWIPVIVMDNNTEIHVDPDSIKIFWHQALALFSSKG